MMFRCIKSLTYRLINRSQLLSVLFSVWYPDFLQVRIQHFRFGFQEVQFNQINVQEVFIKWERL